MGLIRFRENNGMDVHMRKKKVAGKFLAGHVLSLSWPLLAFWLQIAFFKF